jgi:ubiquinone/menaquinone biosynthesis C-methylase UbiE
MELYKSKADLYDKFISQSGKSYEKTADIIAKYLKKTDSILELAAGTGNYALEFKKRGYKNYICSDINDELLEIAKKKTNFKCINLDMKSFSLKEKFDAILILFKSINYNLNIDELKNTLKNSFNSLKKNGKIIIEITNPDIILKNPKSGAFLFDIDENYYLIHLTDVEGRFLTHYFIFMNKKTKKCEIDKHKNYIFETKEIMDLMNDVGFSKIEKKLVGNTLFIIGHK